MPEFELASLLSLVYLQPLRLCHHWNKCFLKAEKNYVIFTPIFKPVPKLAVVTEHMKPLYTELLLPG